MTNIERKIKSKIPGPDTGIEVKQTICDICCPSFHCGVDAYVKDGVIIKIEGTADHPVNHGLLCPKGLAGRQYLYNENRIKTPLRRVGERGEGKFEPISWEDAYKEIASRLLKIKDEYGPESVMFFSGYSKWYRPFLHRLCHSFGSLNYLTESSHCMSSTFLQWLTVTGNIMCRTDTDNSGVYLGWAFNPYYSRHLAASAVEKGKARGMKVIIVDPRETNTSRMLADIHLRPRVGTDGALAHGLARQLIHENMIDMEYINKYVYGYNQYHEYVEEFTPERTEELTGVPADLVVKAARMIGENLPLSINESAAPIAHHKNGFQNYRAIMALSAITGSFDREGGQIPVSFSYNYSAAGFDTLEHEFSMGTRPDNARPAIGSGRFPLWSKFISEGQANDMVRQIRTGKPYPLKAMLGFGFNYRIAPGSQLFRDALLEMDFLVNTELFLTDTCKLCDIVLPACTSYERSELKVYGGGNIYYSAPVVAPLYESRSDVQIICDLAKEMRLGDDLLNTGPEECYRYIISALPVSLDELKKSDDLVKVHGIKPYKPGTLINKGLNTDSGKFELYSLAIKELKHKELNPLPTYVTPLDGADPEKYPLILCSAPRLTNALHSRLHNIPWNRSLRPYPMADMSNTDAKRLGLAQEDDIELFTQQGSIRVKANISGKVDDGCVYMYHGYSEADVNTITNPEHLDPYSGFPGFRAVRCGVRKCGEAIS